MGAPTAVDLAVAIPTLTGNLLSVLGTGFILMVYIVMPPKPFHIRHKLICNLVVAEFGHNINDSVSGLFIVIQLHDLEDGMACVANGFLTQLGVQAIDCSIFVISVTLLYTVTSRSNIFEPSLFYTILLLASPWILPLITSSTALAKNFYHPVSGNWCWIQARPTYLRYLLTHGWRFVIIVTVVAVGLYIRAVWKKRLMEALEHQGTTVEANGTSDEPKNVERVLEIEIAQEASGEMMTALEMQKLMRLSWYPLFYIILWLPGIANRVAEAIGHPIRVLAILQSSTSFIGLTHAITFGWIEVRNQFGVQKLLEVLLGFVLK